MNIRKWLCPEPVAPKPQSQDYAKISSLATELGQCQTRLALIQGLLSQKNFTPGNKVRVFFDDGTRHSRLLIYGIDYGDTLSRASAKASKPIFLAAELVVRTRISQLETELYERGIPHG